MRLTVEMTISYFGTHAHAHTAFLTVIFVSYRKIPLERRQLDLFLSSAKKNSS